jgi:TolB-like protein/tetratricopeptide (TPR) repeat protein
MTPGHLLSELRRRRVLRVVSAYAVAAWVAVEVYTTIQPILWEEYEWTNRLVVMLALLGFPVVIALAWIFDITPQGVVRTAPSVGHSPGAGSDGPPARRVLSARATGFFGLGILVAIIGLAAYAGMHELPRATGGGPAEVPVGSIAVLPFVDMSAAQDQEFFSDGMTEELMSRLSQVPELRVAARTSSFAFKGRNDDVREIGRRLGVQAVLEGSVRRDGNQLRITTKLIDVATGYQLWAGSFDGDATDIFALQDRIAGAISDALQQRFVQAPEAGRRGTSSVRAYELYLLGLKRWNARTDRDLRQALAYFTDALSEDPHFALAHAGLAQTYALLPFLGAFPVDTAVLKGSSAAAQAIAYDPSLAEAYAAMGQIVQNFEWDLRGAESYYQRALKYQPAYTTAHQWYAETLMLLGRYAEASTHSDRVLAADPLSPAGLHLHAFLLLVQGRSGDALTAWRDLARLHPGYELGLVHHALAATLTGRHDEAGRSLSMLAAALPERADAYRAIAAGLLDAGSGATARAALRTASAMPDSEAAAWYMALGDTAAARTALERGFRRHADVNVPYIMVHPIMKPLHGDASFRAMAAEIEIGFPR